MMRRRLARAFGFIGCTAVVLLTLTPKSARAQSLELTGTATNYGLAASPVYQGLMGSISWKPTEGYGPEGQLVIRDPLGGSGAARISVFTDSLVMMSVSAAGDTIAWIGTILGEDAIGEYVIMGGQWAGQGGQWTLSGRLLFFIPQSPHPDARALATIEKQTAAIRALRPAPVLSPPRPTYDTAPASSSEDYSLLWLALLIIGIAAAAWGAQWWIAKRRVSRPEGPAGPGHYAVTCPTCGNHRVSEARTFWFLRGMVLVTRYGSRTIIGCRFCVAEEGLKILAVNVLAGWWCIPWGIATPVVVLQNLGALLIPAAKHDLEDALKKSGIDPAEIRLDEHGFTRDQRRVVECAGQVLATAIGADGVQKTSEVRRAVTILQQLTGGRVAEPVLFRFITEGRNRRESLSGLPFELRQTLLVIALDIAKADGHLAPAEIAMLYRVGEQLGFARGAVDEVLGFTKREEGSRAGSGERRQQRHRRGAGDPERASTILGVDVNASLLAVRQAWRSAILKFHPDRAGPDKAKQAEYTARAQEINWAYEVLQRSAAQTA